MLEEIGMGGMVKKVLLHQHIYISLLILKFMVIRLRLLILKKLFPVYITIFYKGIMPSEKVLDFPVDCNTLTGSVNL